MSIQSVDRALDILQLFSTTKTRLRISEMSKSLGLMNSTVHGLVRTLVKHGFLAQDPETRKYSLGVSNYELGHFFLGAQKIYQVGSRPAHRLAQETGRTSRLAIWDRDAVVVIMNIFAQPEAFQNFHIGPRVPVYCSALGKSILASLSSNDLDAYFEFNHFVPHTVHTITDRGRLMEDLEQTRLRGYAIDSEETLMEVSCLAAPIFAESKQPVAAISVSGGADLLDDKERAEIAQKLVHTSREISHAMGFQPKFDVFSEAQAFGLR